MPEPKQYTLTLEEINKIYAYGFSHGSLSNLIDFSFTYKSEKKIKDILKYELDTIIGNKHWPGRFDRRKLEDA